MSVRLPKPVAALRELAQWSGPCMKLGSPRRLRTPRTRVLPEINPYATPVRSFESPLRTHLMDQSVCSIPVHRRLEDLKHAKAHAERVHRSYDLDGDGSVSISDYRAAKELDRQNCGVLNTTRRREGRVKLAQGALEHRKVAHSLQQPLQGERTVADLSGVMADLPEALFQKHLGHAKLKQAKELNEGSQRVIECLANEKRAQQLAQPRYRTRSEMLDARRAAAGTVHSCIQQAREMSHGLDEHQMHQMSIHNRSRLLFLSANRHTLACTGRNLL